MLALKEPGYDMKDFAPVTMLGDQFYVLMIAEQRCRSKNFKEFVEYAKKNPIEDELRACSAGLAVACARRPFARAAELRMAGHRLPRRHADGDRR